MKQRKVGDWIVVEPQGRIDTKEMKTFEEKWKAILETHSGPLAIDLRDVDFLCLPAIHLILKTHINFTARARRLVLIQPKNMVQKHLDIYAGQRGLQIELSYKEFERQLQLDANWTASQPTAF